MSGNKKALQQEFELSTSNENELSDSQRIFLEEIRLARQKLNAFKKSSDIHSQLKASSFEHLKSILDEHAVSITAQKTEIKPDNPTVKTLLAAMKKAIIRAFFLDQCLEEAKAFGGKDIDLEVYNYFLKKISLCGYKDTYISPLFGSNKYQFSIKSYKNYCSIDSKDFNKIDTKIFAESSGNCQETLVALYHQIEKAENLLANKNDQLQISNAETTVTTTTNIKVPAKADYGKNFKEAIKKIKGTLAGYTHSSKDELHIRLKLQAQELLLEMLEGCRKDIHRALVYKQEWIIELLLEKMRSVVHAVFDFDCKVEAVKENINVSNFLKALKERLGNNNNEIVTLSYKINYDSFGDEYESSSIIILQENIFKEYCKNFPVTGDLFVDFSITGKAMEPLHKSWQKHLVDADKCIQGAQIEFENYQVLIRDNRAARTINDGEKKTLMKFAADTFNSYETEKQKNPKSLQKDKSQDKEILGGLVASCLIFVSKDIKCWANIFLALRYISKVFAKVQKGTKLDLAIGLEKVLEESNKKTSKPQKTKVESAADSDKETKILANQSMIIRQKKIEENLTAEVPSNLDLVQIIAEIKANAEKAKGRSRKAILAVLDKAVSMERASVVLENHKDNQNNFQDDSKKNPTSVIVNAM